ncbi:MAG: hypothetical protein Kow0042_00930 [Calditrichia bacterium]
MSFGLNISLNTNRNEFHRFWSSGKGAEANLSMPFYFGSVMGGVRIMPFRGKEAIPDFYSVLYSFCWGKEIRLGKSPSIFPYAKVGSFVMYFEEQDSEEDYQEIAESELAAGLGTTVWIPFRSDWRLQLSGGYLIVLSYKRIHLMFFSVGVTYTVKTPPWLKELLK